jgi:hypothetical protein
MVATPGELSLYVALSRAAGRQLMWAALARLNARLGLGLRLVERDGQLIVTHPCGSRLWLAGCPDSAEVERFRGPRYRRVAIDEAASLEPYLGSLVEDVIEPALLDLRGELALTGTPGMVPAGWFYDATTSRPGVSRHHWTCIDNPYVPHAASWLAERLTANGWTAEHPRYRREYLGEWVLDTGSLAYPYDPSRNLEMSPPPSLAGWQLVLGVDVGVRDDCGWALLGTRIGAPEVWVLEAGRSPGMSPSAVAVRIQQYRHRLGPLRVVLDSGGLGAGYVAELGARYGMTVEPAQKRDKLAAAEMLRGELLSGQVRVVAHQCRDLVAEWGRISILESGRGLDESVPDHAADACLYAHRACRPVYRPEEEPPRPGSREEAEGIARDARKQAERRVRDALKAGQRAARRI